MALYLRAAKVASRSPGPYAELFACRPRLGWQSGASSVRITPPPRPMRALRKPRSDSLAKVRNSL
jgi:hypothetical protein